VAFARVPSLAGLELAQFLRSGTYEPGLPDLFGLAAVESCVRIFRSILSYGIDSDTGCCRQRLREGATAGAPRVHVIICRYTFSPE
jgi:hypothetical protein